MNLLVLFLCVAFVTADYWTDRDKLIKDEASQYVGHQIQLTPIEQEVNKMLMQAKNKELDEGFAHPEKFPPAIHFFLAKSAISNSRVYKFIQKMPKGGALHVHDTAMAPADFVLKDITYRDNLWACQTGDNFTLKFAKPAPQGACWVPLKNLRNKANSVAEFDAWLRKKISMETDTPHETYPDINAVWKVFQGIFNLQTPMIIYQDVFVDYYNKALQTFVADNVNYVEVRGTMPKVYNLDGSILPPEQVLGLVKKVTDTFTAKNPNFFGVKYIYAPRRKVDNTTLDAYLTKLNDMKKLFPDFLVGFDLVGQEDLGKPLIDFVNRLIKQSPNIKFFFHAGETNWNGMTTDMNLVDALLLNTTRVGHGFAMLKHPGALAAAKRRGVAIELCPASHQVLGLLQDLRNHPAAALLAQDFPLVVSSDDPGFWGATPLSHDFYLTFMGIASGPADLKLLKQLALNSFTYSSLNPQEKARALTQFFSLWDKFLFDIYKNGF